MTIIQLRKDSDKNGRRTKGKNFLTKKEEGWKCLKEGQKEEIYKISNGYMEFLNRSKIEREFIKNAKN